MRFTLRNNGDKTLTILDNGHPVFTGTLAEAQAEYTRLSLAAKGPSVTSSRKQARLAQIAERRQGGQRA